MKINNSILSIPPYISTSWKNILSLHVEYTSKNEKELIITLTNQTKIFVPNLEEALLEEIFNRHASFLEKNANSSITSKEEQKLSSSLMFSQPPSLSFGFPIKGKELDPSTMASFGGLMGHSQEQANAEDLPEEMLKKISTLSKMIGLDKQLDHLPKAEPHCNCPYCQVARAITGSEREKIKEEIVSDEELTFRDWDIQEISTDLYEVSNPLEDQERYQVFLGSPIGCTCGNKDCEHIKAVLKS